MFFPVTEAEPEEFNDHLVSTMINLSEISFHILRASNLLAGGGGRGGRGGVVLFLLFIEQVAPCQTLS